MKTLNLLLSLILFIFCGEAFATFTLPSSRSVTWQGNVGVLGGIPARTTIYQTITAGSGDRTSTIQTALNNCPSGRVVLLGEGVFEVTRLIMPSNVTLRGAGIGLTTLKGTSASVNYIIGFGGTGSMGSSVNLAGGLAKGSTTITTSANHGWSAGDVILIDQLADPDGDPKITAQGSQTFCTWCSRENGTRPIGQVVKLVAPTSGTTATLEIPLYWNISPTKTPQGTKLNMGIRNSGVESLKIDNRNSWSSNQVDYGIIDIKYSDNCWVYNVDLHGVWTNGIRLQLFHRITVSSSIIHLTHAYTSSAGYAMSLGYGGSAGLFENNIFHDLSNGPQFEGSSSGNVFAYNYITNMQSTTYPTAVRSGLGYHGSHAMMNLLEGNTFDGCYVSADTYFGTNTWGTIFRNRINYDHSKTDQRLNIGIGTGITYFNLIGNYMGTPGYEWVYETYNTPYNGSGNNAAIYVIGSIADGYGAARSTMLRHANWDSVTAGQKWCDDAGEIGCQGGSADRTLPESLYLASKPAWYGNESTYPPINPAGSNDAQRYSKIPAQLRYELILANTTSTVPTSTVPIGDAGGGGGGCFIATAAYGSSLAPHVTILRTFRDKYLITNIPGQAFVNIYYKYSPPVAHFIEKHDALKIATRWALTPVIYGIKYPYLLLVLFIIPICFVYKMSRLRKFIVASFLGLSARFS